MKRSSVTVILAGVLALNVACSKDEPVVEEVVQAEAENNAHEFKVDQATGKVQFKAEIVYFGFDESTLTAEGMERLSALGDYMKEHPHIKVRIEGHCDERGSAEYNLALGQKRADSVRQYLLTYGIAKDRILAISFGEEKPAVDGQGEENWAQNRRAEFTFENLTAASDEEQSSPIKTVSDNE